MNRTPLLFLNVLIIATCGLIYELLAGTLASHVLGDSVTQFSLIIGIYLFAMGVGSWLSRFIDRELARRFVEIEISVALLGGLSAPLLLLTFARFTHFPVVLYSVVFGIGVLVGLEIPLLMRILKDQLDFKEIVSKVLAVDYIGALLAALMFPILLVPKLGLIRTSLVFGIFNAMVGLWGTWLLRPFISKNPAGLRARGVLVIAILVIGIIKAEDITRIADNDLFADEIIYTKTTKYQRIVITGGRTGFQLFLNGNLQFNSIDEYRYHEALVHPAMSLAGAPRRVMVLGGGDGLAVREVLKYPSVELVTLVDLDPDMTDLAMQFPSLAELNGNALKDPRVEVVNQDAMIWLEEPTPHYDVAIVDFPDPNSFALGKLYTTGFYRLLRARLKPEAPIGIQCTSPLVARSSFWCIIRTLEATGLHVRPYHTSLMSFSIWGFALARATPFDTPERVIDNLKFLDRETLAAMFVFPPDMGPVDVEINRLDNQALVRYYESEWRKWE